MVDDAEAAEEEAEEAEDEAVGYRIKNKNPIQRCGEKRPLRKSKFRCHCQMRKVQQHISSKRSRKLFLHGLRTNWLEACKWGSGHNGQKRKRSHHACQTNASNPLHLQM